MVYKLIMNGDQKNLDKLLLMKQHKYNFLNGNQVKKKRKYFIYLIYLVNFR